MKVPRTYGTFRQPEDMTRCIDSVHDVGRSVTFHQCLRKRGYGPDGLYCQQHGKQAQDKLDQQAKSEAERAKTPEQKAAERAAKVQAAFVDRQTHFAYKIEPSQGNGYAQLVLRHTTNGTQWYSTALTPEEWRQVLPALQVQVGEEGGDAC